MPGSQRNVMTREKLDYGNDRHQKSPTYGHVTAKLANVPLGDYMNLGSSRLNKMPNENWQTLRVGYSEKAFIMKECKDSSIC